MNYLNTITSTQAHASFVPLHATARNVKSSYYWPCSLLLAAASSGLGLLDTRDDLAEHDHAVPVHEGHTREALAVLERVAHERLLRLEAALSHLVGLQGVGIVHFLSTSLLAHLPLQLGDTASSAAAAHESDRRVANLDFVR